MFSRAIEATTKKAKILIRRVSTDAQRIRFDDIRRKRSYVFLIQRALINFDQGHTRNHSGSPCLDR
jgi:hypothetical protein